MLNCPQCAASTVKKNGTIHNGKQKYECLVCHRQFVEEPENKVVAEETKERIRRALLERVSLEGICRIFDVSMPWLLNFMQKTFETLPEDLNATVVSEDTELVVAVLQVDELWSFVGNKRNEQWLWLVMDPVSRQILAFQVGDRSKKTGEALMAKLPEDLKKKPSFTRTISQLTAKSSHGSNIDLLIKDLAKRVTLRDLIARSDNGVRD